MKKSKLPPIIIDTDCGHDDAMAIMLLVKSRMFDIKAVTTVAGNSSLDKVTNNTRYILDLLESPAPIFSGCDKPLKRDQILANVHGKSGLDGANVKKSEPLNGLAVKKIIEVVRANPGQVSIVVIGPATNIATAFNKDPKLPQLIKQLIIMGGTVEAPGNKSRVAEFNVFCDPEAAQIVFDSPVKKIINPLDVANTMPMFLADFEKLKGTKLYKPIMSMMRHFIKGIAKFELTKGALMYDPLAAYYLINPAACQTELMDMRIETKGELTYGMSVVDRRKYGQKSLNVEVITDINRDSFVRDFVNIIRK
ncbi:MAG: nucleoside hydrolase [bacterium]|nr:nucleoside hydrolase [bacterium]